MSVCIEECLRLIFSNIFADEFVVDIVGTFDDLGGGEASHLRTGHVKQLDRWESGKRTFWMSV